MSAPWERRSEETSQAYEAFRAYCKMGLDRSTRNLAQELGKDQSLIFRWSTKHDWQSRVRAWDDQQEKVAALTPAPDQTSAMRASDLVEAQLTVLNLPAAELQRRLESDPKLLSEMDAASLVELTIKTTRALSDLLKEERTLRRTPKTREELAKELVDKLAEDSGHFPEIRFDTETGRRRWSSLWERSASPTSRGRQDTTSRDGVEHGRARLR